MVLWSPVCKWGSSDKSSVCADAALIEVPVSKQQINSAFLTLTPSVPQHLSFPPAKKNNKVRHGYVEIWTEESRETYPTSFEPSNVHRVLFITLQLSCPQKECINTCRKISYYNSLINASAVWVSTQGLRVVVIFFTRVTLYFPPDFYARDER